MLLAATPSEVTAHTLLTGFQTGPLALLADGLEVLALVLYGLAMARMARKGRGWAASAAGFFGAGVLLVWVAIGSGLAAYDESNVTMHVIQHVLLMMVAPPLLALGRPVTLASQALGRRAQVTLLKIVHSRLVALLSFPVVAWLLYYGTMYVYFTTSVYPYSVAHPLFHDATHLWFFLVGYLYWQPLVGLDPVRWRLPYPARIASLFFGMPFEAFLGISIASLPYPIAPINTLGDTHAGGDALWVLSMAATGLCLAALVVQWFRHLERQTPREDRRAQAHAAHNRARAEELGIEGLRPGFTVPWWRLAEVEARRAHEGAPAADVREN